MSESCKHSTPTSGSIDWQKTYAGVWRGKKAYLKPVIEIENISLEALVGIDRQKEQILKNTKAFLDKKMANNVLLWGSRGCGKSSLVKAVFHHFKDSGLRIIEIERDDLIDLLDIVDEIRALPYRFIIFCDDLSFDDGDSSYRKLKRVLDGSIEKKPDNVIIYATSNRRHLLPEYASDNANVKVRDDGEIHFTDGVEESISLSDRFGLCLSFYTGTQRAYLEIVDAYFKDFDGDRDLLHRQAVAFATGKGIKNGRTAKQFFIQYQL